MKGNDRIIAALNQRLADELTAINQYIVHAEMSENWGYGRLHDIFKKRAIDEMKHAERLIARILFLEGTPQVSELNTIDIGEDVHQQHKNDQKAEEIAIQDYNENIQLAVECNDNGTRELLESILRDEEVHIDWIETQLDQIKQIGIQNYLVEQMES